MNNQWGLLHSIANELSNISLKDGTYAFGQNGNIRDSDLSVLGSDYENYISGKHFTITRNLAKVHRCDPLPAFIHDHSRNGTSVNGTLIGNWQRRILVSGDIISILKSNCANSPIHCTRPKTIYNCHMKSPTTSNQKVYCPSFQLWRHQRLETRAFALPLNANKRQSRNMQTNQRCQDFICLTKD